MVSLSEVQMVRIAVLLSILVPALTAAGCAAHDEPVGNGDDKAVTESFGNDWNRDHGTTDADMSKFDNGSFLQGGQ